MEKKEIVIDSRLQSNLIPLIENTWEEDQRMEEALSFFFSDKLCQPRKKNVTIRIKSYNTTRIKSRNFLSNISYNRVKEEDLCDRNFVFEVYRLFKMFINVKMVKLLFIHTLLKLCGNSLKKTKKFFINLKND